MTDGFVSINWTHPD